MPESRYDTFPTASRDLCGSEYVSEQMISEPILFVETAVRVLEDIISTLNQNAGAAQSLVAASSLIISLLIYFVYRKQNTISAAQHKPAVEVEKFQTHSQRDSIELEISNHGEGPAKDLEAVIKPRLRGPKPQNEKRISPVPTRVKVDPKEVVENEDWNMISGSSIGPHQSDKSFILQIAANIEGANESLIRKFPIIGEKLTWVYFNLLENEKENIPVFEDVVDILVDEEIDRLELEIELTYTDNLNENSQKQVLHYVIPIVEGITLEKAIEYGCEMDEYLKNEEQFEHSLVRAKLEIEEK